MTQSEFNFEDLKISDYTINLGSGIDVITLNGIDTTMASGTGSTIGDFYNGYQHYPTITIAPNTAPSPYIYTTDTLTGPNSGSLHVNGDANFEGDVKIKGKSLVESLEKIEEKLAILHPNNELEERWEQLRDLRKQYMELEKELIEKEKVWNILKK